MENALQYEFLTHYKPDRGRDDTNARTSGAGIVRALMDHKSKTEREAMREVEDLYENKRANISISYFESDEPGSGITLVFFWRAADNN